MSLEQSVYYNALRDGARTKVADALNAKFRQNGGSAHWTRITLGPIGRDEIDHARLEWPKYYTPHQHMGLPYSWEKLLFKFKPRPSYFDLAIWQQIEQQRVLQGLALGKPSNNKTHLTINWIERSFAPTYLKGGILLPMLACAQEYAKLLGCERVLVKDPGDPAEFERYGYTPYRLKGGSGSYMCKEL